MLAMLNSLVARIADLDKMLNICFVISTILYVKAMRQVKLVAIQVDERYKSSKEITDAIQADIRKTTVIIWLIILGFFVFFVGDVLKVVVWKNTSNYEQLFSIMGSISFPLFTIAIFAYVWRMTISTTQVIANFT